jgi:hypothetical protein
VTAETFEDWTTRPACVLGCRTATGEPFPAQHGYLTCDPCADRLRSALTEIVELYALLDEALVPGTVDGGPRGGPGYSSRSPARDGVLALTDPRTHAEDDGDPHSVLEILSSWADNVRDDVGLADDSLSGTARREAQLLAGWLRHVDRQPWAAALAEPARTLGAAVHQLLADSRRTMTGEAGFLVTWLDFITRQYWVTDLADEVHELLHQLRVTVGTAERTIPIGYCPTPIADLDEGGKTLCGAPLRARLSAERITCRSCGTSWPRDQWDELRDDLGTPVSDVASLAVWLNKPAGTLRRWKHEDGWTNHGTRSRPLYARAEVLASCQRRRAASG